MKFYNKKNKEVDNLFIDGYAFGDRLLEDVKFICKIENDKVVVKSVGITSEKYFKQLNEKYWLEQAQLYVDENINNGELEIFLNGYIEL